MLFRLSLLSILLVAAEGNGLTEHVNAGCVWPCFRRRHLAASSVTRFNGSSSSNEPEVQSHLEKCGEHEYEVALFVDGHLHAVATPMESAAAAGCPMMSAHALFDVEQNLPGRKELMIWNSLEEGQDIFQGSYPLGNFKLAQLKEAFDVAEPNAAGYEMYDVVTNNCGSFMISLANALDVKVDSAVTSFVVTSLLKESGKDFFDNVRSSANFFSLFDNRHLRAESVSDEQLAQLLVENTAGGL